MQTLLSCHVKEKNEWITIDASTNTLRKLMEKYTRVRLFVIDDNRVKNTLCFPENANALTDGDLDAIVGFWLSRPTTDITPYINNTYRTLDEVAMLKVRSLWDFPVDVTLGNRDYAVGEFIPSIDVTDLIVTDKGGSGVVADRLQRCVIAIDGKVYQTTTVNGRLCALGAATAFSKENPGVETVEVYDFSALGDLTWIPMTSFNTTLVRETINVDTNMDLTGKHAIVVINNTPVLTGIGTKTLGRNVYQRLNRRDIAVDVIKQQILQEVGASSANIANTGPFIRSINLLKYVTRGNCALLVIDNDDVCVRSKPVEETGIYNNYNYPYPPQGVLVGDDGNIMPYRLDGYNDSAASITVKHNPAEAARDNGPIALVNSLGVSTRALGARMVDVYSTNQ